MLDVDPGLQGEAPARPRAGLTTARRGVSSDGRKEPGWGANPRPGRYALRRSARLSPRRAGTADRRCGGSREGRARRSGPGVQLLWLNALHSSSPGTPKPPRGAASDQTPASSTRCLANYRTVAQRRRPERDRAPLHHRRRGTSFHNESIRLSRSPKIIITLRRKVRDRLPRKHGALRWARCDGRAPGLVV